MICLITHFSLDVLGNPLAYCVYIWLYIHYLQGCVERLATWMRSTADILFVLGYCVIAFLKLSFLGILRYEIKEMIQKIKLLQTELATSILGVPEVEQQQVSVLEERCDSRRRGNLIPHKCPTMDGKWEIVFSEALWIVFGIWVKYRIVLVNSQEKYK